VVCLQYKKQLKTEKMKQISLLTLGAILLAIGAFAKDSKNEQTVFKVETDQSKVLWTGKKVTGQHTGMLALDEGEMVLNDNEVVSAKVKLDMNSISNSDLTDPQWNKKLVDHLKSEDFFSVEKYPQASFVTTGFSKIENEVESDYTVTGNLTIKGITHEISFPVNVEIDGNQLTANGTATLDRTKWDIKYGSGSFFSGLGDKMIYDEFEIEFDLVANAEVAN
jgi:polyisoprenoid-binding protein YceI